MTTELCKEVFTIPQFTGTCWFNSLLMALFYSELSRNFFLDHLENVPCKMKKEKKYFYKVIDHFLRRTYIKSKKQIDEFQNQLRPENILRNLHKVNKTIFYFDPTKKTGWTGEMYLPQLFEYIGMKQKVLFLNTSNNEQGLQMSLKNYPIEVKNNHIFYTTKSSKVIQNMIEANNITKPIPKKDIVIPDHIDILVIERKNVNTRLLGNVSIGYTLNVNEQLEEVLQFKNTSFKLDSMLLANFNMGVCKKGHQISGVTCKDKRFLYNGWTTKTKDPARNNTSKNGNVDACDLFEFDWFANKNKKSFCIDSSMCEYPQASILNEKVNVCFDIEKGAKTYIYLRDKFMDPKYLKYDVMTNSPYTPFRSANVNHDKCPPDKIINPKTNRCVSRTGAIGKKILNINKSKEGDKQNDIDKCMKNHTVKELRALIDKLQQPKSLKTKRKLEICTTITPLI